MLQIARKKYNSTRVLNLMLKFIFGTILIIASFLISVKSSAQSYQLNDSSYVISQEVYDNIYSLMQMYLACDSTNMNLKEQIKKLEEISKLKDTIIIKQDTVIKVQEKIVAPKESLWEGLLIGYYGHTGIDSLKIHNYITLDAGIKIDKARIYIGFRLPIQQIIKPEIYLQLKYKIF